MARARSPKGLTDEQVSTLREALAANRRPRVALQGNQFGDDARGQVVAVGDAAVDGDEFISVRVKLAGVSDTLRFSPDELSLPGSASKSSTATRPVAPASRKAPVPAASAPRSASRRASGKRKAAAAVTVTVSSSGHSWTLSASRGGRSLLKATPVSAGVVTAVTALFADPALSDAVADINQVALTEAEERADTLRKELAAVESILQSHRRPGS